MSDAPHIMANRLAEAKYDLASLMTEMHFGQHPELEDRYGKKGREKCYEDAVYHLNYLEQAVRFDSKTLFGNYLFWARTMLRKMNIPEHDLDDSITFMKKAVRQKLPEETSDSLIRFIEQTQKSMQVQSEEKQTYLKSGEPLGEEAKTYLELLLNGKRKKAAELIQNLVKDSVTVKEIYEHIFQKTQYEVGLLWQRNKITVAHEHYCTAATQQIMSQLYPRIFATEKNGYTLVACSVADELHEIGIRMVADFFEMEGWDTYYMGANMPSDQLIDALKEYDCDVLAISVTMTFHLEEAAKLIKTIRSDEELADIKILAGGYPFRIEPDLWEKVGADGSAASAKDAITIAHNLIE